MRKIHKKLDMPPINLRFSVVECGSDYPGVVTDNWRDTTCQRCQEKNPEGKNGISHDKELDKTPAL